MAKVSKGTVNMQYDSSSDESEDVASDQNEEVQESESGSDFSDDIEDTHGEKNSGWADAISRVLQTKTKKSFLLSKAKKDRDVKAKTKNVKFAAPIEVVEANGAVKIIEEPETAKSKVATPTVLGVHTETKRKEWENLGRKKPTANDKEKEVFLNTMATKGVVQLFNAVNQQQKLIQEKMDEAGPSERKKDMALASIAQKKDLLAAPKSMPTSLKRQAPEEGEKAWKVLREDFMGDAKMKDWDQEDPEEEESN